MTTPLEELKELMQTLSPEEIQGCTELLKLMDTKTAEPKKKAAHKAPDDFTVSRDDNPHQRTPVKAKKSTWVDDGEGRNPEDKKIQMGVVKSSRPASKMVEVVCSACSKKIEVPSSLPRTEYYRCERCVG